MMKIKSISMVLAGLNLVFIALYFLSFGSWVSDALAFGGIWTASLLFIPPAVLLVNGFLTARKKQIGWLITHLWATAMMLVADYILLDTFSALSRLSSNYSIWQFMHGAALWITAQGALSLLTLILLQHQIAIEAFKIPKALRIGAATLAIASILITFWLWM